MAKTVTFYFSEYCEGCHTLEPIVKEAAQKKGLKFKTVDVESCNTKRCDSMEWVPSVYIGRKELSMEELEAFLNE